MIPKRSRRSQAQVQATGISFPKPQKSSKKRAMPQYPALRTFGMPLRTLQISHGSLTASLPLILREKSTWILPRLLRTMAGLMTLNPGMSLGIQTWRAKARRRFSHSSDLPGSSITSWSATPAETRSVKVHTASGESARLRSASSGAAHGSLQTRTLIKRKALQSSSSGSRWIALIPAFSIFGQTAW